MIELKANSSITAKGSALLMLWMFFLMPTVYTIAEAQPNNPQMPIRSLRGEQALIRSEGLSRFDNKNSAHTHAAPTLNSPANNTTDVPVLPFLYANPVAGATSYDFQISSRSDFSENSVQMYSYYGDGSGRTDGLIWNIISSRTPLANNTRYFWRVRAFGSTEWSAVWSFTTAAAGSAPPSPTLTSPANGASNVSLQPEFQWTGTNANGFVYRIEYSEDPTFTWGFGNVGNNQTWFFTGGSALLFNTNINADTLKSGTRYYWRVRAFNANGGSSFSSVSSFTTQGQAPTYIPISLQGIANAGMSNVSPLNGNNLLANIPFNFPTGTLKVFETQDIAFPSLPTQVAVATNINNPQNVYLLLDGKYIYKTLQGQALGNVVLSFANGATQTLTLRAGEHLRENWSYVLPLDNEQFNVITDFPMGGMSYNGRIQDLVRGNKPAWGFLTVLRIPVQAALRTQQLTRITLNDASSQAGMILSGVTVEGTASNNRPPRLITTLPNLTLPTGRSSQFMLNTYFTDDDGDGLTYSITSSAPSLVSASVNASGLITIQALPSASPGTATITIAANDGRGGTVTGTFTVTVTQAEVQGCSGTTTLTSASGTFSDRTNSASQYANNLDCRWIIQPSGGASSITINFSAFMTELGFDAVSIYSGTSISGAPLFNFSGSTIPQTVTVNASAVLVRFVTDGSVTGSGWTLNYTSSNAPTNRSPRLATTIPNQTLLQGQNASLTLASFIVDDDGNALTYTVATSNPSVASVLVSANGSLTIQGVSPGIATITLTANDGRGGTVTTSFAVTVTGTNSSSRTFDGGITITPFPFAQNDSITISVDITQTYPRRPEPASLAGSSQVWIHGGVNVGTAGNANTRWQRIVGEWRNYPARCQFTRRTDNPNIFDLRLRPTNFWQLQTNETISELCFVLNNGPNGTGEGGSLPIAGGDPLKGDFFIPVSNASTNRPPRVIQGIASQTIQIGRGIQIPLTSVFADDDRDALTYTGTSSNPNVASLSVNNSGTLILQGLIAGTSTISITANDGRGGTITTTFLLTVEALSCSGTTTLTSASGSFTDRTNSAAAYTNNLDCRWLIQPSGSPSSITITFSRFETETCCDFVEIYSGTTVGGTPLQRFSGNSVPSTVIVNNSAVVVRFVTDGSVVGSGWGLSYNSSTQPSCSGTTTFSSVSGSFTDRANNAATYTNSLDCRWLIQPSGGANSITITFSRFSTETCCDFVEIYSGTSVSGTPVHRFSGTTVPSTVVINSSAVVVRFVTDGSVVGGGWQLNYTSSTGNSGTGGVSLELPATTDVRAGTTFTIPLTVGNLTGLNVTAYQCVIAFNNSSFTLTGGDLVNTLSSGMNVTYNTTVPGQLTIVAFGSRALSGSGTLINLTGRLVASSGEGAIAIRSMQFNEGMPTASIVSNGSRVRILPSLLCGDVSQNGAVSSLDASLIAQHVSGSALLTGVPLQAADVSGNREVTAFDASLIAQFVAGSLTSFPNGCPPPTFAILPAKTNEGAVTHTTVIPVSVGRLSGRNGSRVMIPINVGNMTGEGVVAFALRLNYDPNILRISGVSSEQTLSAGGSSSINTATSGEIRAAYFTSRPLTGQGVLINLDAEVIGTGMSELKFSQFSFNEGTPQSSISNGTFTSSITSVSRGIGSNLGVNILPNPTSEIATIEFTLEQTQAVRVTVYDAIGAEIARLWDAPLSHGQQRLYWQAKNAASGVYTVRVQTANGAWSQMVHIIR